MLSRNPKAPRSVFHTIMRPLLALLIGEAILLSMVMIGSNVNGQLNRNYESIVHEQVQTRASYISSSFAGWADLSHLAEIINSTTAQMVEKGEISLDELDSDSDACAPLVMRLMNDLLTTLYSKRINGIFVIFNTQDLTGLSANDPIPPKTGVSIRDMDPTSAPSVSNEDLMFEHAPIPVVKSMDITTNTTWQPKFSFSPEDTGGNADYFLKPAQAAFAAGRVDDIRDYGYWCSLNQHQAGMNSAGITYSIPLVLEDGTVYGVLGIQVLNTYLRYLLPNHELFEGGSGVYCLSVEEESADALKSVSPILCQGVLIPNRENGSLSLTSFRDGYRFTSGDGQDYFLSAAPMPLYNNNSIYENDHWMILGAVPINSLHSFSRHLMQLLIVDVVVMLLSGLVFAYLISRRVSDPIRLLSQEVSQTQGKKEIPDLSTTGIAEIDHFSDAITTLSREVVDNSTRFLNILTLASVELGGFEVRYTDRSVFVTDNFFSMLSLPPIPSDQMTSERFLELLRQIKERYPSENAEDGSVIYTVSAEPPRYIRVKSIEFCSRKVGVTEDITASILKRKHVERERDFDLLTGLYNRRSFYAKASELFSQPEKMKHAALMMMDLDNLKFINDHYGHDWGDKYIRGAAQTFVSNVPPGTLCARVSGDEFFVLFHGYDSQNAIRKDLDALTASIRKTTFSAPSGRTMVLSASGGVAWYPEDGMDFQLLMRYADFAMYEVKRTQKGQVAEFNMCSYNEESYILQAHLELRQFIDERRVTYHFQPIVDGRTGKVFAYEALMRSAFSSLRNPEEILRIAREMNMLQDIECLTWLMAPEAYMQLRDQGKVEPDALLFINSISNQVMTAEAQKEYRSKFSALDGSVVVEFTESEDLVPDILELKRKAFQGIAQFALDDYGSGYNSERNLLTFAFHFIKVDMSIIRDIDVSSDKQSIVANIVAYAHERGMRIVAEGVETMRELKTVLDLDVDLVQGYLFARPATVPQQLPKQVLDYLRNYWLDRDAHR